MKLKCPRSKCHSENVVMFLDWENYGRAECLACGLKTVDWEFYENAKQQIVIENESDIKRRQEA